MTERTASLPCIVCGRDLENVTGAKTNQPYRGTAFVTYGHYGSTAYDPMDESRHLELNVCDVCLAKHSARVVEVIGSPQVFREVPWKLSAELREWIRDPRHVKTDLTGDT